MWSEKHRPRSVADMIGNEEPRSTVIEWFTKWKKGTRPILLAGPPGTGKTTMAYLAARQFGYDVVGLNASDARSKSRINEILRPVLGNVSVHGSPMIFVDEVDGIHGRSDYGGADALVKILKDPAVPIVLAANYPSSDKMKGIVKAVKTVAFRPIPPRLMAAHLRGILEKEGSRLGPGSVFKAVSKSRGDIRSMINLAQSLVTGFDPQTEAAFESVDIEEGVNAFFKAKSEDEARAVLYSMQVDPRQKIGAFYSSIVTSGAGGAELAESLEVLSRADALYGRILRTQNWRLLRYLNEILLGLHRGGSSVRYSQYNLPWPLLNRIRWDGRKLRALSSLMARRLHTSPSSFATSCLPYALLCMKNGSLGRGQDEAFDGILEKEIESLR